MDIEVRLKPYGPQAFEALCAAVEEMRAERGHSLAPVTVVVDSHRLGIVTRRALARRRLIGVDCLTVRQVAEQLAGETLARQRRRPVSAAVLGGVVRQVLQTPAAGVFEDLAEHAATERALADAYETLRELSDEDLARLERTTARGEAVVSVVRAVRRRLADAGFHDERDLLDTASSALRAGSVAGGGVPSGGGTGAASGGAAGDGAVGGATGGGRDRVAAGPPAEGRKGAVAGGADGPAAGGGSVGGSAPGLKTGPVAGGADGMVTAGGSGTSASSPAVGAVVLYLPQRLGAAALELLEALGEATGGLVVIAGVCGSSPADAPVKAVVERLAGSDGWQPPVVPTPAPSRIVALPDADEEVRTALRGVVEGLRAGVPLQNMAVLYGRRDPYARLVHDQLVAADLPFSGPSVRPVAESVLGRFLLGLLGLPARRYSRQDVLAWLSAAPVRTVPLRSGPLPSGPVGSEPARSGPDPVGPARSAPVRSAPVGSGSVRPGEAGSGPAYSEPAHSGSSRLGPTAGAAGDDSGGAGAGAGGAGAGAGGAAAGAGDAGGGAGWRPVPVAAWERISRSAGVLHGAEEWSRRINLYCGNQRADITRLGEESDYRITRIKRDINLAEGLRDFMAGLLERCEAAAGLPSWRELAAWASKAIRDLMGGATWRTERWPPQECSAAEQIEAALERLAGLDPIDPKPDLARFRRALEAEMGGMRQRVGRTGRGLLIGPVSSALGADLERVWILGLAEGVFPGQAVEGALLGERERAAAPDALVAPTARLADDERHFLAALAAATGERTLLFPRGDLRRTAERLPSRWLLAAAQSAVDDPADTWPQSPTGAAGAPEAVVDRGERPQTWPQSPTGAAGAPVLGVVDRGERPQTWRQSPTGAAGAPEAVGGGLSPESHAAGGACGGTADDRSRHGSSGAAWSESLLDAGGSVGEAAGGGSSGESRSELLLDAEGLAKLPGGVFREVASATAGLAACAFPVTRQEYDMRRLLDDAGAGRRLEAHPLAGPEGPLHRATAMLAGRRSKSFTRFDGNLAGCDVPSPADDEQVVSATRLEMWVTCPHGYFMRYLLGVEPVDPPERELRISNLERGDLVHTILDRFFREVIAAGSPAPDEPWSEEARQRLKQVAEEIFAERERQGRVGQPIFWDPERRRLHRELQAFLDADEAWRSKNETVPWATEKGFAMPPRHPGEESLPPVEVVVDGARTVRIRGAVDRIDVTPDGGIVVIDYKTGKSDQFKRLGEEPWRIYAGKGYARQVKTVTYPRLQLPLYAHAARQMFPGAAAPAPAPGTGPAAGPAGGAGADFRPPGSGGTGLPSDPAAGFRSIVAAQGRGPVVTATYWFVKANEKFKLVPSEPLKLDARAESELRWTLAEICDGIAGGVFPANPTPEDKAGYCDYCNAEESRNTEVGRQLQRKSRSPDMLPWLNVGARWLLPPGERDRLQDGVPEDGEPESEILAGMAQAVRAEENPPS